MATAGKTKAANLEPLDDWIIVEETNPEGRTKGGIYLPDQAKKKTSRGVVLAAGPGRFHPESGQLIKMPVGEGDTVLFGEWSGAEVEIDGEKLRFLRAGDVMSKMTNCK